MKFNFKRMQRTIEKKCAKLLKKNKRNLPALALAAIVLVGLIAKQPTHARSRAGEGALFGGLGGAAIGGALGGGRGAGIGAAVGLASGALIGSASKDRDPVDRAMRRQEKQLDRLYKRRDKVESRMIKAKTDSKRAQYERELQNINQEIDSMQDNMYGRRGSRTYRPGGYAVPRRY